MHNNPYLYAEPSLILLAGVSGAGKTTLAKRLQTAGKIGAGAVLSSDHFRTLISDDPNNNTVHTETFELLRQTATYRLRENRVVIADSTNLRCEHRNELVRLAKHNHVPCYLWFVDPDQNRLSENRQRSGKQLLPHIEKRMHYLASELRRAIQRNREQEYFHGVIHLRTDTEIETLLDSFTLAPTVPALRHEQWIVIGDVHGCGQELQELLALAKGRFPHHKVALLGDLYDYGDSPELVTDLVLAELGQGGAWAPGNHDLRLQKMAVDKKTYQSENPVLQKDYEATQITLARLQAAGKLDALLQQFPAKPHAILGTLNPLVVVHGAIQAHKVGKVSRQIWQDAAFGFLSEEQEQNGLPLRLDWQGDYAKEGGKFPVVCGHQVTPRPAWRGNTINIDTGCVYGGRLTALIWPEGEIIQVKAKQTYRLHGSYSALRTEQDQDDQEKLFLLPDPEKEFSIRLPDQEEIRISSEKLKAALSAAGDIQPWHLWFLAPTISPAPALPNETEPLLEYPGQALAFYRDQGIKRLVAQTKHMGSRATLLLCRDQTIAKENFGDTTTCVLYSRGRRPFWDRDNPHRASFETELSRAMDYARPGWEWALLDMELLPWALKGKGLIADYFLPSGFAQRAYRSRLAQLQNVLGQFAPMQKLAAALPAAEAYVRELELYGTGHPDAPWKAGVFNCLALQIHGQRELGFAWSAEVTEQFVQQLHEANPERFLPLNSHFINLEAAQAASRLDEYWRATWGLGEGIVIKPDYGFENPQRAHPAIKTRNPDYLRIIYGLDYLENIEQYRHRNTKQKLRLSQKQYQLSIALLQQLTQRTAWQDTHQLALAFIALDQEQLDPRL